jgi:hypothetical protein
LAIKQAELQLKMAQMQNQQGEDPVLAAQRVQQEIAQAEQMHQAELVRKERQHMQNLTHNQQTQDLIAKQKMLEMLLNTTKQQPKKEE